MRFSLYRGRVSGAAGSDGPDVRGQGLGVQES